MTQVTIGWQLGGQAYSQIIFFEDKAAYEDFIRGNFELGAQASAVALTAGASAHADTAGGASAGASGGTSAAQVRRNYVNGMAIFTVAKGGLMYEASVGGQKFTFRPVE
jgi:lipid-binding SYLF domain-containing protein